MQNRYLNILLIPVLWGVLVAFALWLRPLLPMDETRYLSVAWEMWNRNDFLVPHLNGHPYSHKPPLLFWIMHAGWALFGVNDIWPRLVAPLFGLGCLFMTRAIAFRLWPEREEIAQTAPLILIGALFWTVYTTLTMFDMLVASITTAALLCILAFRDSGSLTSRILLGVAIGVGALAKGPVILLYVLPVALLAPVWDVEGKIRQRVGGWLQWYQGIGVAVIIGFVIGFGWAIPAALLGGEEYRNAILWGQTAGRVVNSFAHRQPVWWYGYVLPATLLPWMIWPPLWRSVARSWFERNSSSQSDGSILFCLTWFIPALLVLSVVSGKQPHYLLPFLPAIALLFASLYYKWGTPGLKWDKAPVLFLALALNVVGIIYTAKEAPLFWGMFSAVWIVPIIVACYLSVRFKSSILNMALISIVAVISFHGVTQSLTQSAFDLSRIALKIGNLQKQGNLVVHIGKYHGQFHFLGRLQQEIKVVDCRDIDDGQTNISEAVIISYKRQPVEGVGLIYTQQYRGKYVALWDGAKLMADKKSSLCGD